MYVMTKKNDGTYVMSEIKHYGKGHLDGGHSGRYPWGSGDNPKQRVLDTPEKKRRVAKAAVLGTIFGGPIIGLTAGYISFRRVEKAMEQEEVQKLANETLDKKKMDEGKKKLSEVADKMDNETLDDNKIEKISKNDPFYGDEIAQDMIDSYEIYGGYIPDYNNIKMYPAKVQEKMRSDIKYFKQKYGSLPDWEIGKKFGYGRETDADMFEEYNKIRKKHESLGSNQTVINREFLDSSKGDSEALVKSEFLDRMNLLTDDTYH